ncbi:putative hyoscyamine (6S)-dioxygenase [Helianthus annuus]|nr:putative hyoscyamine (6S)-dioxygenase [Helianthus annuus]
MQIISNWKFKSAKHQVVTSTYETRLSIATFVNPSPNCIIEPAKNLVNELEPTLYKASQNMVNELEPTLYKATQNIVNVLEPTLYKPIQYKDYLLHSNAFGDDTAALQNGLR